MNNILRCAKCDTGLKFDLSVAACQRGVEKFYKSDEIYVRDAFQADSSEMLTRDRQAAGYLKHEKFPTQISSFSRWLNTISSDLNNAENSKNGNLTKSKLALDLGCGPGPYTKLLQNFGYEVIAVDFSKYSLFVNSQECKSEKVIFLQEDLNKISLVRESVDLVVMPDFLQHLGSRANRERLLKEVTLSLKKDGSFYLSFFNLNIKNFVKGDVHGDFSGGDIKYERLTAGNVLTGFDNTIKIDYIMPMNIAHGAIIDRILTRIPGAKYLARMMVIAGTKI